MPTLIWLTVVNQVTIGNTFQQIDGEEGTAAMYSATTIVGHFFL